MLIPLILFFSCADEQLISDSLATSEFDMNNTADGTDLLSSCTSCTYVVPAGVTIIDAAVLGLQPGSVIGLDSRIEYGNLVFRNLEGTYDEPIVIRNCGGVARVNATGKGFGIKTENSKFFRITGGDQKGEYGIIVTGGTMGVTLQHLSTHFEVDHIEVQNSGFAGIMAKTDPGCDEATWRENFVMKGVALHNNYIHDTGGEGIYAGNSFFMGMDTKCGKQLPHEIHYIRIFGNIVKNTGWDGIQLGCATRGASIHANIIENYGMKDIHVQNNGIQIGAGTGGVCYNNLLKGGTGNGIIVMGLGDNIIYNNVIDHPGNHGVFCDERYSPGEGFVFLNNTILNPGGDGIRIYAEILPRNVIVNNIITNPGSYYTYTYPRKPEDAFIYKPADVDVVLSNNYFSMETASIQLDAARAATYRVESTSPIIDQGADISAYNIRTDFNYKTRLRGAGYDIGAVEHY